jgi:hypothetical protein
MLSVLYCGRHFDYAVSTGGEIRGCIDSSLASCLKFWSRNTAIITLLYNTSTSRCLYNTLYTTVLTRYSSGWVTLRHLFAYVITIILEFVCGVWLSACLSVIDIVHSQQSLRPGAPSTLRKPAGQPRLESNKTWHYRSVRSRPCQRYRTCLVQVLCRYGTVFYIPYWYTVGSQ